MKTKLGASLIAALMMMGLFGTVSATADPGPNDKNNKGLCTAYFNGSDTGRANKRNAPPFQGLEAAAEAADETVAEFCEGLVGGNPNYEDPEGANPNSRGGRS
ncbi:MAG TPA: hypothetical protein VLR27_02720 [Acidimicrobiales bacterium]|nr:hypothetical protein [Acidimicrobiales bacterium]